MKFGQKLANLIKQSRMTKIELAQKLGLKDSSGISHWVRDRYRPDRENIAKLAQIFEKPVSYFDDEVEDSVGSDNRRIIDEAEKRLLSVIRQAEKEDAAKRIVPVGVLGTVSAELFNMATDNSPDEYLPVLVEGFTDKKIFALKIRGACMHPRAEDGDYAIVEECNYVEDGKLAVLRLNDEYTLKRVFRHEDYIELKPDNPKFKSIKIKSGELKVVGQVKLFCRKP